MKIFTYKVDLIHSFEKWIIKSLFFKFRLGTNFSPIRLVNVACSTSVYLVILQCSFNTYTYITSNCISGHDDASVTCSGLILLKSYNVIVSFSLCAHILVWLVTSRIWDNPYNGMVRLTRGSYSNEGLVEVYCNGQWGTVCDDGFSSTDANTVCKQLGYSRAVNYDHLTSLWVSKGCTIWDKACRSNYSYCICSKNTQWW